MADYQWTGDAGNGEFAAASNWQNTTTGQNPATSAPGANDNATIAIPVATIDGPGAVARLTLNGPATIGSGLVIGGAEVVAGGNDFSLAVNSEASMATPLLQPGNDDPFTTLTTLLLYVGYAPNSAGAFTIGLFTRVVIAGNHPANYFAVSVGQTAGSSGTLSVSGADASLINDNQPMAVGNNGAGTLVIESGGAVTAGNQDPMIRYAVAIGNHKGATGTVTVTDAKLTANGAIFVGRSGSGTLNVNAFGFVKADNMFIGAGNMGGVGSVAVSGAQARLDLLGLLQVGNPGTGALAVTDQGEVFVAGAMTVNGAVTLTHGAITAASIAINAAGTIDGDGELIAAGGITIAAQGAIVARQGLSVTGPVTNNGSLGAALKSYLSVSGPLTGEGTVPLAQFATVSLGVVDAGQTIVFSGPHGTLSLRLPGAFSGAIQGFGVDDIIEIEAEATHFTLMGGIMTLTGPGGAVAHLKLIGAYTVANLHLTPPLGGKTIISFHP